jgi:S1-C subfamily serine protease
MSEHWPPPTGSEDATGGTDPVTDPQNGPAIPLPAVTPAGAEAPQPLPGFAGAHDPTGEQPSLATGSPTPPAGTWPVPPGGPSSVPWGAGAPGGVPPYGGWTPPGISTPPAPAAPPKRRNALVAGVATVVVVAAVAAGVGLGHAVWPATSPSSATASPPATLPGGSGSSGGNGGSPSSGSENSPFGSGSSGTSAGAGAPSDISSIASKVDPGLVDINTNLSYQNEQAAGTGMVITSSGEILTNNHVIDGATSISVTDVGNGKTYTGHVVGYDRTGDVAVLQLSGASGLQAISTSTAAAVGQAIVGVGNAGGTGGTPSTAGGSIVALGQSITASDTGGSNSEDLTGLIEVNAAIEPGDSGGSLVNTSGQVIGMDTAASTGSGYQVSGAQAYAIPISTALSIARQIESGHASSTIHIGATGFLGIGIQPSSSSAGIGGFGSGSSDGSGSSTTGAVVAQVLSSSAAGQAGVAVGDVITSIDGSQVATSTDLSNLLEKDHPGDTVQLQWTDQSGQSHTAGVKLATGPPA